MINPHVDTRVPPLRSGIAMVSDTVCYKWAVFSADYVTGDIGETIAFLVDWHPFDNGPGRSFAGDVWARRYGRKVIVRQRCGIDS